MMNNKVKLGILAVVVTVGMIVYKIVWDKNKKDKTSSPRQEASSTDRHDSMWN